MRDFKVEHCVFRWTIENFSLCRKEASFRIFSPHFKLDPDSKLVWCCVLYPCIKIKNSQGIFFYLIRYINDEGPETVCVNIKISFFYKNKKLPHEESHQWYFKRGYRFISSMVSTVDCLTESNRDLEEDHLVISCEILYTVENKSQQNEEDAKKNYGVQGLCEDMKVFLKGNKWTDVTIKVIGGKFQAHKAILSSRSSVFRQLFEKSNKPGLIVKYKDINYENMDQILWYIYTGELGTRTMISLGLFECAERFELLELADVLRPCIVNARSVIETELSQIFWNVNNFNFWNEIKEEDLECHHFGSCFQNRLWTIKLSKKSDNMKLAQKCQMSPKSVTLSVECHGKIFGNLAKIKICITGTNGETHSLYSGIRTIFRGRTVCVTLLHQDVISKILKESKDLIIDCKIYLATGCCLQTQLVSEVHENVLLIDNHEKLSSDYLNLLKLDLFNDFKIITDTKEYNAHKCFLSARCSVLEKKLDNDLLETITLSDFQENDIDSLLIYIYTGKINNFDPELLMKLWKLANIFGIYKLRKQCYLSFKSILNIGNVCHIVTLLNTYENPILKTFVRKFINKNLKQITEMFEWTELVDKHPDFVSDYLLISKQLS